jgi:succinate-acetate transporter protein
VLWVATFRHTKALVWVFTTLLILFVLLDVSVYTGSVRLTSPDMRASFAP